MIHININQYFFNACYLVVICCDTRHALFFWKSVQTCTPLKTHIFVELQNEKNAFGTWFNVGVSQKLAHFFRLQPLVLSFPALTWKIFPVPPPTMIPGAGHLFKVAAGHKLRIRSEADPRQRGAGRCGRIFDRKRLAAKGVMLIKEE